MALGVGRKELVMVGVLLTGTLLAVLNLTMLSPALPAIMADLGVDATTAQWLTSVYALVEAVVIPLLGLPGGALHHPPAVHCLAVGVHGG